MDTLLRQIPKVDDLLRLPALNTLAAEAGTSAVTEAVRRTLDRLRADILVGTVTELPSTEALCAQISASCRASRLPSLRGVINATGIVLHTNLGRACLSDRALAAARGVSQGYSTLEYDLTAGERGQRYAHVEPLLCRLTGAEAAQRVLYANGIRDVQITRISGNLTDHYDPRDNVIRLSDSVYGSTSTAAIGVACHEAGHAVQYAQDYAPIKLRAAIIPVTNFGSQLAMPLILLGIVLSAFGSMSDLLIYLGIGCFGLSLVFQLVTLPVEFNASRRALVAIEEGELLTDEELMGARKTLRAAALTYVAATAVALAQLLRLLAIFGGRRRRD